MMLGQPNTADERFGSMKIMDLDGTEYKKLSECKDGAACTEFSLLGKHLLDRFGINAIFVDGSRSFTNDGGVREPHAYIILPDENIVFDIMQCAVSGGFALYSHSHPMTSENLGNKLMICSRVGEEDNQRRNAQFTY